MTVQELIDELSLLKNKDETVRLIVNGEVLITSYVFRTVSLNEGLVYIF